MATCMTSQWSPQIEECATDTRLSPTTPIPATFSRVSHTREQGCHHGWGALEPESRDTLMGGGHWKMNLFCSHRDINTSMDHGGYCQSGIESREARETELMLEPLCKDRQLY